MTYHPARSAQYCGCDPNQGHTCADCRERALQERVDELARDRQWLCDTIKWFVTKERTR